MIVCVAANPSIDKLFEVERLHIGAIHRPRSFTQVPGGKGLNCARAAAALGADVTATGILAGHTGRWIDEALAAEGVQRRFVWTEGESRACLSVASATERGVLTEFYERGPDIGPEVWRRLEELLGDIVSGASWITISGSVPPGVAAEGYVRLAEIAAEQGVRVAIDTEADALTHLVKARPVIVKVNADEAAAFLGSAVATEAEAVAAAREIRARMAFPDATAIVTRGVEGALACTGGEVLRARLQERGPYPVGSGDAFLAGLVTALERDDSWEAALRLALGAAASNAELPGAGRLSPRRAVELGGRAVIERVD